MGEETKYHVGQWVRAQRNGELVIGVIAYVRKNVCYPYEIQYVTDIGTFDEEAIVEAR